MRECPNEPGVDCIKGPRKSDGGCCRFPRGALRALAREVRADEVHDILRQLESHSPTWVKKLRAYITQLEAR